jgi:hypothetical protein
MASNRYAFFSVDFALTHIQVAESRLALGVSKVILLIGAGISTYLCKYTSLANYR